MDISVERGFTSLPKRFFRELPEDLSHGARLTLAILCEHADAATGKCSLCYRTLGNILRRSKASISAYIRELRQHGLVTTEQTSRFGYKGPCIFTLPFYKSFRSALAGKKTGTPAKGPCPAEGHAVEAAPARDEHSRGDQGTEHCVQPPEHSNTNQNLDNKTTTWTAERKKSAEIAEHSERSGDVHLLREWQELDRGSPYPSFNQAPSPELVQRTIDVITAQTSAEEPEDASTDTIRDELNALWTKLQVRASDEEIVHQAKMFREVVGARTDALPLLSQTLRKSWKRHWKRPSTAKQFREVLASISAEMAPRNSSVRQLLEQYLRRHERVAGPLPSRWSRYENVRSLCAELWA